MICVILNILRCTSLSCRKWWMLSLMWMMCLQMVLQPWGSCNIWNAAAEAQRTQRTQRTQRFGVELVAFNPNLYILMYNLLLDQIWIRYWWLMDIDTTTLNDYYTPVMSLEVNGYDFLRCYSGGRLGVVSPQEDSERSFCPGCGCGAI